VEQISDQDIIKGLKNLEFSLWDKLLQKTPLSDCDREAFLENLQYIAAGQRATQIGSSQHVSDVQEYEIFHLYQSVNGLLTALPAIQAMQTAEEENGIEEVKTVFKGLDCDTQEAVEVVLNLVRYTDFIERIRNASDLSNKGSGGGALSKLLKLIPATSLQYRAIVMGRDNPNSLDFVENRGVEDPQWLDGIRQVAAWAAVLCISTIQNTVGRLRALAPSRDHTQ
jgi:hypothetical protein